MYKEPKISVIVPVYNKCEYLEKCLASLCCQTYSNLEIICIDDGSTDGSFDILDRYKKSDDRFIVIRQENCGVSVARNKALSIAQGNYISFIDADDWVFLTLYKTFIEYWMKYQDLDIYVFNASSYIEGQNDLVPRVFFETSDWSNHLSRYTIHSFDDCMRPFSRNLSAANKIYRKEFLNKHNIKFPEGLKYEDQVFCLFSFLNARSIMINDNIFYRYRNMISSSATLEVTKKVFDIFKIVDLVEAEIYRLNLYDKYKYALFQYKFNIYSSYYQYCPEEFKLDYYTKMKALLLEAKNKDLNPQIYTKLKNYETCSLVIENSFQKFDAQFRTK